MPKTALSTRDMLAKLISFDTISSQSNLAMIDFVEEYLNAFGFQTRQIRDASGQKANLYASRGPQELPGILLSGHTDVVPVEGQNWHSDPFVLREHDGLLYGRGTTDMKGFIAAVLARLPALESSKMKMPLHLAFSYDEEVGCLGARDIIEHVKQLSVSPLLCIVGEPTNMNPITGHKGIRDYSCCVRGKSCHSSLAPYGVNAVEAAAELIAHIKSIARRMQEQGPYDTNFDPPFTTLHVGTIKGGTAQNIVPQSCTFGFEFRFIPETDPDEIIDEIRQFAFRRLEPPMKEIDPTTGIQFKCVADVPAFDIDETDPAVAFVQAISGANDTSKVSFGTEAGLFAQSGIPTVVCGPGDINQAHKPDEFIALDQLKKCEASLDRLWEKLSTA